MGQFSMQIWGVSGSILDANQHLYLAGNKEEAVAAVPDELVDEISLVGDEQRIREQAKKWLALEAEGLLSTMIFTAPQPDVLPILADIFK